MRRRGVCAASDGRVPDPRRRRRGAALRTLAGVFGLTPSAERRDAGRRDNDSCWIDKRLFAYWIDAGQRTRLNEPVVAWRREHLPAERSVFKRITRASVSGEMARCPR